ncbi:MULTISPECIES: hypothetical protein [Streptosporangium]|uniref:Uncharacterized protein n=1 Tax=Streptosporangium brasiliense TaxID=47480 RepID=A0ABT9RMA3_9ACTN|nr:hypothetical protein [Streptosporangium brasiliense]MDP9870419.1 hypothetical protein [Streptosporangium brasiliense]
MDVMTIAGFMEFLVAVLGLFALAVMGSVLFLWGMGKLVVRISITTPEEEADE